MTLSESLQDSCGLIVVFRASVVCACGFRSSVRGQHPECPLLSQSGSVPRFWSLHRPFSAGCSSRCAVWLRPLPDDPGLTQWHLCWVLPSLLLRRLAGQPADLTSSGKTSAPSWNSHLAAVFLFVFYYFYPPCLSGSDVRRKTCPADVELLVCRQPARRHRLPPYDHPLYPAVIISQWGASCGWRAVFWSSSTLVVVLSYHFVTKHPVRPLRFQQLWSSWSSPIPTQRCPSTCPSIVGPCTPCWVEPASASRPNTLWGGWMPGIPARATAVRPPGTSRLPVFIGPQVQGSALWLLTTHGCIMRSSCSCLCTKNVG